MRRWLLVGWLASLPVGCGLLAGLEDREAADALLDATSLDGASEAAMESGAGESSSADSAAIIDAERAEADRDAAGDAGGDAASDASIEAGFDAAVFTGVVCGVSACDAAFGCCVDDASCQSFLACPGKHASCDGPEDCSGTDRCCSASPKGAGLCTGQCGTYRCHIDADCTVATNEPHCCPEPLAPQYGRCQATVCN